MLTRGGADTSPLGNTSRPWVRRTCSSLRRMLSRSLFKSTLRHAETRSIMSGVFNSSRLAGKTVLITGSSGAPIAPSGPHAADGSAASLQVESERRPYALHSLFECKLTRAPQAVLFARAGANLILTARRQPQLGSSVVPPGKTMLTPGIDRRGSRTGQDCEQGGRNGSRWGSRHADARHGRSQGG